MVCQQTASCVLASLSGSITKLEPWDMVGMDLPRPDQAIVSRRAATEPAVFEWSRTIYCDNGSPFEHEAEDGGRSAGDKDETRPRSLIVSVLVCQNVSSAW
ncbi:hypothetical protein V3481_018741 [Fusarium oxysporum f. sp. vasinfectum]